MKSIKRYLLALVLLFTVSVSAQADAAFTYSDGTETAVLTSITSEKATLQYCGIEANFSILPEETNSALFTYQSDNCKDKFSVSPDGKQLALGAFQFNKVLYLSLVSSDNYYPSNNTKRVTCYTCHGTGSCVVCHGTGTYSNYGQSHICRACGGDGKCWHCHGSGIQ